jgi:hypothetical protein
VLLGKVSSKGTPVDVAACSIKHVWDVRTGSPQRIFGAIVKAVGDLGYGIELDEPFSLEQSPVSDKITLRGQASGGKRMSERYNWSQGIWAIGAVAAGLIMLAYSLLADSGTSGLIMLPFGIVLLLFGTALAVTAVQTRKLFLIVLFEGKALRSSSHAANIIADVRIIAGATPGFLAAGMEIDGRGICQPYEGVLKKDFAELENSIESILQLFATK